MGVLARRQADAAAVVDPNVYLDRRKPEWGPYEKAGLIKYMIKESPPVIFIARELPDVIATFRQL